MLPSTLRRLGLLFRIEWWLRGLFSVALVSGCAQVKPCEFPMWVRVTPDADEECRALGVKWKDMGGSIKDTDRVLGCAPKDRIITNGTESNMGHEMAHQVERNCK